MMEYIDGKKITIFTSESKQFHHRPMYEVILEQLRQAGVANAAVTRGMAGFGSDGKISTINIEVLSLDLPIVIEATDTPEKIDEVAQIIAGMLRGGLMEVMPVQIVRGATERTI
jgi:PII-like signaling protein